MIRLTDQQQAVFSYIRNCILARGYGPTVREIGEHMEIKSPNGVMSHLRALERKGVIHRSANKKRAIELVEPLSRQEQSWEIRATVSAGVVTPVAEPYQALIPAKLFGSENSFLIDMLDNQLQEVHIYQGDKLVIGSSQLPSIDQILLVKLHTDSSWFLGRCLEIDQSFLVQSFNRAYTKIGVAPDEVVGVAVGLIRIL